jgi:DNA replication protein DnaC
MQYIPPLNTSMHGLGDLLAARKIAPTWFNADNGDPYGASNIARWTFHQTSKIVPFLYRQAIPDNPAIDAWLDELVGVAREEQSHAPVATVRHGRSLMLLGPTGVGKTYQAYGAMRALSVTGINASWTVTTAANLYAALRPRHGVDSETEFRAYRDARMLLIDDLGAAKPSEFTEDVNFRLINHRYENHLPTLFTSNVLPKELAGRLGDRVASRLVEMCQHVVITGQDRRRNGGAAA